MLTERGMAELTFEAVAWRYQNMFNEEVIVAAENRLRQYGIELRK
jgi:hypothetical protein